MRRCWLLGGILATLVAVSPARAEERPPTRHLVYAGLGMAPPTFVLGTAAHEGSHALAAVLFGARVTEFRVVPGFHPRSGKFYFGYVNAVGLQGTGQRTAFYLAPKLTDALVLGGYALAVGTGTVPENRYGRLALVVAATGFWVDFSKDVFAFWDHNDLVKVYSMNGLDSEWRRLPARLVHASLSAAATWALVRGYQGVFAGEDGGMEAAAAAEAVVLPLWTGSF